MVSYGPGSQVRLAAALAAPIVEALGYVDAPCDTLLEDLELSEGDLQLEGARVTHAQWLTLLERGTALSGDPAFPLRAAECLRPEALGLGSYIAAAPGTIGEAYGGVAPLFRRLHASLNIELEEVGLAVHCRFRFAAGLPTSPELSEYLLACFSVLGRKLMGNLYRSPDAVHFRHPASSDPDQYRGLFGCEVLFAQPRDGIIFPRQHVALPLFG